VSQIEDQTIALAGMAQAGLLVQQLARTGECDGVAFDASIKSVLILDAVSSPAIYGSIAGVRAGLNQLSSGALTSTDMQNAEVLRYVMQLINLQQQLFKKKKNLAAFSDDIEKLASESEESLVNACSSVYREHISQLTPQIMVQGEQGFLTVDGVPEKVRACLLAGIRAAVLWSQKGGGRFSLLFKRNQYVKVAQQLLN
jgi:high frequency lysogenization protein